MRLPVLVAECDNCGLCCTRTVVRATAVDAMREPRIREERRRLKDDTGKILDEWLMNSDGDESPGPCAFHGGDRCTIYATRPAVCVSFQAGNPQCLKLRTDAGLPGLKLKVLEFDEVYAQLAHE